MIKAAEFGSHYMAQFGKKELDSPSVLLPPIPIQTERNKEFNQPSNKQRRELYLVYPFWAATIRAVKPNLLGTSTLTWLGENRERD